MVESNRVNVTVRGNDLELQADVSCGDDDFGGYELGLSAPTISNITPDTNGTWTYWHTYSCSPAYRFAVEDAAHYRSGQKHSGRRSFDCPQRFGEVWRHEAVVSKPETHPLPEFIASWVQQTLQHEPTRVVLVVEGEENGVRHGR